MTIKQFKGKAIYNPSGKAGEYSYWACNFYTGCSNDCSYCYCKRGVMSSVWSTEPKLKSGFRDENHALELFEKELKQNLFELREHGLFFSFTTDPLIEATRELTFNAVGICVLNRVPVKLLTKDAEWVNSKHIFGRTKLEEHLVIKEWQRLVAWGFTLTGHDDLEVNSSTNKERIDVMNRLHNAGFKTFASIEPVIDFYGSMQMIQRSSEHCNLFKIGLESNKKYDKDKLQIFIDDIIWYVSERSSARIYFKDGLLEQAGIKRESLPSVCVNRDYNLLKSK